MAKPVSFREFTPGNSRDDLLRRLEDAPEQNVEAVLSAYELLRRLHEKGLLDIASGMLVASDSVIGGVVDVVSSRQAVTALRTVLLMSNLLATLDADRIHTLLTPSCCPPPSLWAITKTLVSRDSRRGMAAVAGLLNTFGMALNHGK